MCLQRNLIPKVRVIPFILHSMSWVPKGVFTLVFSSDSRFFECERLCDRDACCTGFGFLNVSQLQGEGDKGGIPCPLAYHIRVETHLKSYMVSAISSRQGGWANLITVKKNRAGWSRQLISMKLAVWWPWFLIYSFMYTYVHLIPANVPPCLHTSLIRLLSYFQSSVQGSWLTEL